LVIEKQALHSLSELRELGTFRGTIAARAIQTLREVLLSGNEHEK